MSAKPQPKKTTRELVHKFTEDEVHEMTENLTSQMLEVVKLELEKKESAAEYKRQIDRYKEQNNRLAKWLNDGEKPQETAVEIYHNWPKDGVKTIVRMDTYDSWEEPMEHGDNSLDNNLPMGSAAYSMDEEE